VVQHLPGKCKALSSTPSPALPKKINKETSELVSLYNKSNGLNRHMKNILSDTCGIHSLLRSPWNFLKTNHILGHKASLNKYQKRSNLFILSKYNEIKFEINSKKNYTNTQRLSNTFLKICGSLKKSEKKFEIPKMKCKNLLDFWNTA
jgi:hypothetical protein